MADILKYERKEKQQPQLPVNEISFKDGKVLVNGIEQNPGSNLSEPPLWIGS